MSIRVAVVDDEPIFRAGLCEIVRKSDRLDLVAHGDCHEDAVTIATADQPQVLVLDADMPGSVADTLHQMRAVAGQMRTVLMSSRPGSSRCSAAFRAGARGVVLRDVQGARLVSILQNVHRGQIYVEPALAGDVSRVRGGAAGGPRDLDWQAQLTRREKDVLRHVSKGLTNKEIARHYDLSEKTVKHHVSRILHKLQARNRVEAALIAKQQPGWNELAASR
ncbi:MAG: response regulator transcription factor [Pseudomonadota bacterium]